MSGDEDLLRAPECGVKARHRELHGEYLRFLRAAADAGRTEARGLTPREHRRRLSGAAELPEEDLRTLTAIVESCLYGRGDADPDAGAELARRLAAALPAGAPPPVRAAAGSPSGGRSRPRAILATGALVVLAMAVAAGAVWAVVTAVRRLRLEGAAPASSAGGITRRGGGISGHRGWDPAEAEAAREAFGGWASPREAGVLVDYRVPAVLDPSAWENEPGLDLVTGQDHNILGWSDPVRGGLSAHHRLFVYDSVDSRFRFGRRETPLLPAEGESEGGAAEYVLDTRVRLVAGRPVPVPCPAPGSVVLGAAPEPDVGLRFLRDPADTLLAVADRTGPVRLVYRVACDPGYLDAPLPPLPWEEFRATAMPVAANVAADARIVIRRIGGLPAATYAGTVRRLQAYFASFVVAPISPDEKRASPLLTLGLARKGVCRHRARCFMAVANTLGLPARLVENEIHSFAEVQLPDGRWRAIELRILESPPPPPPLPPDESGYGGYLGLLAGMAALLFFAGFVVYRNHREEDAHRIAAARGESRAARRARRDTGTWRTDHSVAALADFARSRLVEALEVEPHDGAAVSAALDRRGASHLLKVQVRSLLDFRTGESQGAIEERYVLAEVYWSARAVLEWLGREGG